MEGAADGHHPDRRAGGVHRRVDGAHRGGADPRRKGGGGSDLGPRSPGRGRSSSGRSRSPGVVGIAIVYYFAPDAEQDWIWITPGSVLATILWLLVSLGFRFYVTNFGAYNES